MKSHRRRLYLLLLVLILIGLCNIPQLRAVLTFPDSLRLSEGEEHSLRIGLPITLQISSEKDGIIKVNDRLVGIGSTRVNLRSPVSIRPVSQGEVSLEFSLFGIIPLRRVTVDVIPDVRVVPGGDAIGILVTSEGVIVTGFEELIGDDGRRSSPGREGGLIAGDIILRVNGEEVYDRLQLSLLINKYSRRGSTLEITIKRDGVLLVRRITPLYVRSSGDERFGQYKIGVYVDDNAAGVGTLTFYDPETLRYGALGHMVSDSRKNQRMDIRDGRLVQAQICGINQGSRGRPGEKLGTFQGQKDIIGTIEKNSDFGIFGRLMVVPTASRNREPLPVAFAEEVHEGPAYILTVLEGNRIEKFDVLVQKVVRQRTPDGKGLVIKVVDQRLLKVTGGIIQGMSGSPIIQDGKLIGAVTHVFVNDPTRGYGVLAEWMLLEAGIFPGDGSNLRQEAS